MRQFLATESSFKMMKNAFYFTLKAFFDLKIIKLLIKLFGHVEKQIDLKDEVNFEIDNVTTWERNNYQSLWLATGAPKPKVSGLSPAATYVER